MNTSQPMQLRAIIAELLSCYKKVNKKTTVSIINAIPHEITITKSGNWLAPLMGDLYDIILTAGKGQTISISAKSEDGRIKLYAAGRTASLPTLQPLPTRHQFGFRA